MNMWQIFRSRSDSKYLDDAITSQTSCTCGDISDPALFNAARCKQCGACTPFCPAYLDSRMGFAGSEVKPYLPRRVTESLRDHTTLPVDIDACTQCYGCEMTCVQGVSIGRIINLFYEQKHERAMYRRILNKKGYLPPLSFLPFYTRGFDFLNYIRKRPLVRGGVNRHAVREVLQLMEAPREGGTLSIVKPKDYRREPPKSDTLYLSRSCCNFNFPGDQRSFQAILERVGIECISSGDQSCCGGAPHYLGAISFLDKTLMNARNLCVIHDSMNDLDRTELTSICPTCYDSYRSIDAALTDPANRHLINRSLREIDQKITPDCVFGIHHSLEILLDHTDEIRQEIEVPLSGLKVAIHLSCHYKKWVQSTNALEKMEKAIGITGARISHSPLEQYCCGGTKNLFDRLEDGRRDQPSLLNREKYHSYREQGADLMVIDCPGCQLVLDQMGVPSIHIAQLLALAMGEDPRKCVGLQHHTTTPIPALRQRGIL